MGAFQPAARTGTAGHQVLGKISAEKLLKMDFTALQLLSSPSASATGPAATTGAGTGAEWHAVYGSSTSAGATTTAFIPKSLFGPLLSEASLHFDASTQEWVVVSLLPVRRHIEFCRTRDILAPASSPWNCTFVAEVASQWVDRSDLLTYAAKAHPHLLSTPSTCMNSQNTIQTATDSSAFSVDAKQTVDLIVSYVSNAVENTDILYHPEYKEAYSPKFVRITHIL